MNSKKSDQKISPQKILGLGVVLMMAAGALIVATTGIESLPSPLRQLASTLNANPHLTRLNATDRARLGQQIIADRCYRTIEERNEISCKRKTWIDGDPSFWGEPPQGKGNRYFNRIPRDTQAVVTIACNPNDGKFYTQVRFPRVCPMRCDRNNRNCQPQNTDCGATYFKNPYDSDGIGPFSNTPTNWLTSPGAYNELDFTHFKGRLGKEDKHVEMTDTSGVVPFGSNYALNELHFVVGAEGTRSSEWRGTPLTNTIMLDTLNGIYMHGSEDVTGFGKSRGCVRLEPLQQKGLFDLVRRVGTKNMQFEFKGYGPYDSDLGGPACSAPNEQAWLAAKRGRGLARLMPQTFTPEQKQQRNLVSCQSLNFFSRFFKSLAGTCERYQPVQETAPQPAER